MNRILSGWLSLAFCAVLGACAALPPRAPVVESRTIAHGADTRLGRLAAWVASAATSGLPTQASGFRLMPQGEFAFNARIALAARAEKSLDVQYYEIRDDAIGRRFLRELRDAARRGVRVRVLVDDFYAAGEDALFLGLASHPSVEVRIYNPLPWRDGGFLTRLLLSAGEFARINHRMHNKLLVADDSFAVAGGRNIAADYFMQGDASNFVDIDVLASGPVVGEMSTVFDRYWNSPVAFPMQQVASRPTAGLAPHLLAERFDTLVEDAPDVAEADLDVLRHPPVAVQLDSGRLTQHPADARVVADSPLKAREPIIGTSDSTTVGAYTLSVFAQARSSVEIISPYFIPGQRGLEMMRHAVANGGRVELITNSAGATDEPLVHASYTRYRLAMLQAGVRIFELGPELSREAGKLGDFRRSFGRLHVKSAIVDDRLLFIGSMNMDARSADTNTEMGLFIDAPGLIAGPSGAAALRDLLRSSAYELRLTADRRGIEWLERRQDGTTRVHAEEPATTPWQRLKLNLLSKLVGERML